MYRHASFLTLPPPCTHFLSLHPHAPPTNLHLPIPIQSFNRLSIPPPLLTSPAPRTTFILLSRAGPIIGSCKPALHNFHCSTPFHPLQPLPPLHLLPPSHPLQPATRPGPAMFSCLPSATVVNHPAYNTCTSEKRDLFIEVNANINHQPRILHARPVLSLALSLSLSLQNNPAGKARQGVPIQYQNAPLPRVNQNE